MAKGNTEFKDVHFCFDRIIAGEKKIEAMDRAIHENVKNAPFVPKLHYIQ